MKFYDGDRCGSEIFGSFEKEERAWTVAWNIKETIKKECTSIAQVEVLLDRVLAILGMEPLAFTDSARGDQEQSQSK